jgi:hypothetical protein
MIHGALLTASTRFMRKRTMDVYMENTRRQTLPTIERYIATSVQWRGSNVSMN